MKTMQKKLSPGEYRTIKAELTAHLRKKGVSTPDADDIVQESIYKYLVSSAHVPAEKTQNYLKKIATHTHIDSIRERSRFVEFNEDQVALAEVNTKTETSHKLNIEIVSQLLNEEESSSAAVKAFKSFYLDGKKLNVIAAEQSVPLGTVTSWVKRTRDRSVVNLKQRIEALDLNFVGNQALIINK